MKFFERIFYLLKKYGSEYLNGTLMTLLLALVGTFVGLLFGCGLAIVRNLEVKQNDSKFVKIFKIVSSKLAGAYIQVFRGTPMMVQAMIIFFGGSYLGFEWNLTVCGLIIITLNTTAYMAEIVRSGINSVDVGQIEGAKSLGMTNWQIMTNVVLPQALKNAIPTIGNEFIVNIKDSSVLNVITVSELFMAGKIAATTYMTIEAYTIVALIYLTLTLIFSKLLKLVEKKLDEDGTTNHEKVKVKTVTFSD
jgi:putative lysine transport system permease protein